MVYNSITNKKGGIIMELSNINNLNVNLTKSSEIASKINEINNVEKKPNNILKDVEKIDSSSRVQNPFTIGVMDNVNKISNLQKVQAPVVRQLDIANEISNSVRQVIESPQKAQELDDIQPKIEKLITSFNNVSTQIRSDIDKIELGQEDAKSRVYFDGILGSKPLSSEEIFKAVDAQKQRLQQVNQAINNEVSQITTQTKQDISFEIEQSQQKFEFRKPVEFEAQTVKEVEGSLITSQANAQPEQNIKLLAS